MRITIIGVVCVLVLLAWGIRKVDNLLWLTVFFAPFNTCAVVEFQSAYIQPSHLFFLLFLIFAFVRCIYNRNTIKLFFDCNILLFLTIVLLSVGFAMVFDYNAETYGIGNGLMLIRSRVSSQNYTQLIYLFSGILLYLALCSYAERDRDTIGKMLWIISISGAFIMLIGLYQVIANRYSLPFVEIFKTSVKGMWQTMNRVQSTMNEASVYGQYCGLLLPLYIRHPMWKKRRITRIILILLNLITGIASLSTTYLIEAIACFFIVFIYDNGETDVLRNIGILTCICIIFYILYKTNNNVHWIVEFARDKFMGNHKSSIERSLVARKMLSVGVSHPIIGIGYGSGRSTDVYTSLFATVGIAGLVVFLSFYIKQFLSSLQIMYTKEGKLSFVILVELLISYCSCPDLVYMHTWVFVALIRVLNMADIRQLTEGDDFTINPIVN